MEITEENFNYSNVKEWIKDYSHQDKVKFGIYCAELVIDIYERNYDSKAPRFAIEAAKAWVESPTEQNRKAACAAASAAVSAAASAAAVCNDDSAAFEAADAAFFAARAGGDNVKFKIISWFNNSDHKC